MKNYLKIKHNPYIVFLPFLVAFIIYVLMFPSDGKGGDELRYLFYAQNLIHGFYSPPAPNIQLINGPGYPIILIPFLLLKLPAISMTLLNAFFYYFSIIFLFKALKEIVSFGLTMGFSLAWAFYCIAYQNMVFIHTETFTYLLISILIFSIIKSFKNDNPATSRKYILLTGFTLGYLVLTKMIFGYPLLFMTIAFGFLWFFNRNNKHYRKGMVILMLAFITTTPYLIYTYQLTGRLFYWGMGSDSLFCMSTPFEEEYGDFKVGMELNPIEYGNFNIIGADSILRAHHQADYIEINKYTGIQRDDAFKRLAIQNIKSHPIKFAQNVIYNMGRLVFHFPFSQAIQRPKILMILPINGALLTLMLFSFIATILNWRRLPFSMKFLLILTLLYLGASSLVTAFVRMFTIVVPILLFWIAFVANNTLKINLKFKEDSIMDEGNLSIDK